MILEGFKRNMFWLMARFPRKMALLAPWLSAERQSVSFIKLASSKITVSNKSGLFSKACYLSEKEPAMRIFAFSMRCCTRV